MDRVIDYAGLFPPASLSLDEAVANFAAYRVGAWNWMLGRFIIPVARLDELAKILERRRVTEVETVEPWPLSVLVATDPAADVERLRAGAAPELATVECIEIKAATSEEIERAMKRVPKSLTAYFEIPAASEPRELIATIANVGARAKVRTGGITPEAIPTAGDLARFIERCAQAGVPFKATAGLHHPLRSVRSLTDTPDGPRARMHGFLNVLLATSLALAGASAGELARLLDEESAYAFCFESDGVTWRDQSINRNQIARARQRLMISFGSCSFEEPIADLDALRLERRNATVR
jgi:hypothetical protein